MSFRINSSSTISLRAIERATESINVSLERLSTGKRINSGADGPSDVIVIDTLRADITGMNARIDGLTRNNFALGARDGALSVVTDLAIELEGLIVRTANGDALGDAEREGLQVELTSTIEAMQMLGQNSMYDGRQTIFGDVASLGLDRFLAGGAFDLFGAPPDQKIDLEGAQEAAESIVSELSTTRAAIGAAVQGNESEINVLTEMMIQTTDALSTIEDVDFAREASELTRAQILQQAALTTEQISRQQAQATLELLNTAVVQRA